MTSSGRRTLRERDADSIAQIGKLRFSPVCVVGGRGSRLIEEGGASSWTCPPRSERRPSATATPPSAGGERRVRPHGRRGSLSLPNDHAVGLAEDLLRLTPGNADRRVWFGHSGSDANDCAMRVLQAATGRGRFISFIGSYHGGLSGR